MYDRTVKAALFSSNRFVDLHDDTQRLLYVFLLLRSNDFGCQDGELRELLRDCCHATQIHSMEQLTAALEALQRQETDLVRGYIVADKPYLYLPRFFSTRSYTTRAGIPASPWCDADAPQGRFRAGGSGLARTPRSPKQLLDDVIAQRQREGNGVKGKRSTKQASGGNVGATLAQGVDNSETLSRADHDGIVTVEHDLLGDPSIPANNASVAPTLRQGEHKVVTQLSGGEGKEKRKEESSSEQPLRSSKRGTRIDEAWTIPPEWIDWAIGNALDQGQHVARSVVLRVSQRFHDYYLAKTGPDATSMNWLARWRSWWAREDLAKLAAQRTEPPADAISRAR